MVPPRAVAAVDIGTNSVLMLLTGLRPDGSVAVELDRVAITRLGQGVAQTRALAPEAVKRTLNALSEFAEIARERGAAIVAAGTSALREVTDPATFLQAAERVLGAPVEVISGAREAELAFRGAIVGLKLPARQFTVVDVGGGSSEIARGRRGKILETASLNLGAVRLAERYALSAPAGAGQLEKLARDIERVLEQCRVTPVKPLVAIGGTATTLAAIAGEVEPYDPARIHGKRLTIDEIDNLLSRLARMSLQERYKIRGLEKARADVIVSGALILRHIAGRAQAREVIVSNGGIRFALAQEAYGKIPFDYTSLY